MTREEAIEVYKGLINTKIKEAFEFFAPELRESEDERHRKWILEYLYDGLRKADEQFKGQFNAAIAYLEKQKEQKPAEWSKEDEKMLDKVCCLISPGTILNAGDADYCLELKQWIVSLQERILKSLRPQPKKNDMITPNKKFFQWIYDRLVNVHNEDPNVDYMTSFKRRIEEFTVDEPSWKPSKEQMGALNYAYCELFKREDVEHNILGPLQNLIDTLRKL